VSVNGGPFVAVYPEDGDFSAVSPTGALDINPPAPPWVTNVANLGVLNAGDMVVVQFVSGGDAGYEGSSEAGSGLAGGWEVTHVALAVGDGGGSVSVVCVPPSGSTFPVGTNLVCCTATDAAGNTATCCFTVTVEDREAPQATCVAGVNPSGKKIPVAGKNPASGQNPDGFYQLLGKDNCDGTLAIYVADTGSDFIAGPFASGDVIKLTQSPGKRPSQDPAPDPIVAHLHLRGDGLLFAVDAAGNESAGELCLVPRPPK